MQLLGVSQGPFPADTQPQEPSELEEQQQQQQQVEPSNMAPGSLAGSGAAESEHPIKMETDGEQQQHGQEEQERPQQLPAGHAAGQAPAQPGGAVPAPARNVLSAFGILGAQTDALPAASAQTGPSQTGTGSEADGGSLDDGEDVTGRRSQQQQSAALPPHGTVQLAPCVQDDKKAVLQAHWQELRQRVQVRGRANISRVNITGFANLLDTPRSLDAIRI